MSSIRSVRASACTFLAAALVLLLLAPVAEAHGLGSEDPNRPTAEYLWLGIKHLLLGWDHLLFIAAVVLVAGSLWRATKMISLFVLGHSITLSIATAQEWTVSTTFVDIVVVLSVVAVAVAGLSQREINWKLFGGGLFAFGLIHGLGLSTRLQELGINDDGLAWKVLLFNLGIEIGQALVVLACAGIGVLLARYFSGRPTEQPRRLAFTAIGFAALVGLMVISIPEDEAAEPSEAEVISTTAEREAAANCTVTDVQYEVPFAGGGHPAQEFYEPDQEVPSEDFIHVLYDGYVVANYRSDLPEEDVAALRDVVNSGVVGLIGGPSSGQDEAVVAYTLEKEFRCDNVDPEAQAEFRDEWIAEFTGQS